jgi:hypothetical protein
MIVNPCSEIVLSLLGGFCIVGDAVPFHAETLEEAEEAFRVLTRSMIRVNLMDFIYDSEVKRTNRIGVSITGVHEFAWKFFKCGFRDLINPDFAAHEEHVNSMTNDMVENDSHGWTNPQVRAAAFWLTLNRFNRAVYDESVSYSKKLGLVTPHTMTTIKPAGSVSKLFGLTEGWHLPALAWMVRWVQFRSDDPLVEEYKAAGYPFRDLRQYSGTTIIGFPTAPVISELGMGDKMILAGNATPEEQYKWLMLGEKYWIDGVDEAGNPHKEVYGNQISYTLKVKPELVDYKGFRDMLIEYQPKIRCCAVMPQEDGAAYEYQPEQAVTKVEFEAVSRAIRTSLTEDIGREHIDCESGACPVTFFEGDKSEITVRPEIAHIEKDAA